MTEPKKRGPGTDFELSCLREAYERACQTIAAMHAAAVGEVRAPRRGAVQDVLDAREEMREEIDHLASLVATTTHQLGKVNAQLIESCTFYEKRIDQLVKALAQAGVEDPGVPESERKTIVSAEFYDELVAGEVGGRG